MAGLVVVLAILALGVTLGVMGLSHADDETAGR